MNYIQVAIQHITVRLTSMDQKMTDFKQSQKIISEQYDTLSSWTVVNRESIIKACTDFSCLRRQNSRLKMANDALVEDMIDMKCRSMNLNMMFHGIPEGAAHISENPQLDSNPHGINIPSSERDLLGGNLENKSSPDSSNVDRASISGHVQLPKITVATSPNTENVWQECLHFVKIF